MKKETIIKKIKTIIAKNNSFTTADVNAESSPCISSNIGRNILIETFNENNVECVVYDVNDTEIDTYFLNYEVLTNNLLKEILTLCHEYDLVIN